MYIAKMGSGQWGYTKLLGAHGIYHTVTAYPAERPPFLDRIEGRDKREKNCVLIGL